MRTIFSILGLGALLSLAACDGDGTANDEAANDEAESQGAGGDETIDISRSNLRQLRTLADRMERVFGHMLKGQRVHAFTDRKLEQAEDPAPFSVTIKDLQLMTPYMSIMKLDQTFSNTKEDKKTNRWKGWGAGITVEIKNETDSVLFQPNLSFGLKIGTGYGDRLCLADASGSMDWRYLGSPQTNPKKPWAAETKGDEMYWRPGEVLRRQMSAVCSLAVLFDTGITGATVVLDVRAQHLLTPLGEKHRYSLMDDVVKVDFPTDALTLRRVKLGDTDAYAFGSGTVSLQKGKITRGVLNTADLRPDSPDVFSALPDTTPTVNLKLDELSISMEEAGLTHWADHPGMKKGTREFKITVKQAIDSATIKGRLNAAVAAANTRAREARATADKDNAAVAAAGEDPAAVKAAKAQAAKATKTAAAAAKAAQAAQKAYDSGLAKERSRLGKALTCERIRLVTPSRDVGLANGKEAKAACAALSKGDQSTVILRFTLRRYEVPLGLYYTLAKKPSVAWIASHSTTNWDPR